LKIVRGGFEAQIRLALAYFEPPDVTESRRLAPARGVLLKKRN
jgi:hypothetical protein